MAKRYSGSLQISVVYDDKNHYRTAVSRGGKLLWRGIVNPAPVGFGPGVAYDSSKAYDEVASSALAFADHEIGGISDEAEYDEDLTGFLIRRSPRSKTSRQHATKKRSPPGGYTEYRPVFQTGRGDWIADDQAQPSLEAGRRRADALQLEGSPARVEERTYNHLGHLVARDVVYRSRARQSRHHSTKTRRNDMGDALTEADFRQAAKFDMDRFGLTLPEALKLVKDKRYPGILKTIDDWRGRYGWPAANSGLTRGYIYELLGMQRGGGRTR